MASLLKRGLEREGYAVDIAATGKKLVGRPGIPYDALVLDAMIPSPDGFDVCRQLQRPGGGCRSSCSPLAVRWVTGSAVSMPVRTTTCPSRSPSRSCWPDCARSCAGTGERPAVRAPAT